MEFIEVALGFPMVAIGAGGKGMHKAKIKEGHIARCLCPTLRQGALISGEKAFIVAVFDDFLGWE
jgi:hypothetical protein